MSNIIDHAKRELDMINEEPDVVDAYLKIVETFAGMGHSGGSAFVAIPVITALLSLENLSPLTNNPSEWRFHDAETWGDPDGLGIWQNVRNGEAFSKDNGKTYWLLSEDGRFGGEKTMHIARSWDHLKAVQEAADV